jgi:hypothetical protein
MDRASLLLSIYNRVYILADYDMYVLSRLTRP